MNWLVLDCEWTVRNFKKGEGGDPFDPRNRLCLVGTLSHAGESSIHKIEYDSSPFGEALRLLQGEIDDAQTLVLFNGKRDLHWLRRYGIRFQTKKVWDIQLGHFIRMGQSNPYPSLDDVAEFYQLGQKSSTLHDYLSKKIDVDEIPLDLLTSYLARDLSLSRDCFLRQLDDLDDRQQRLVRLQGLDLLILEEMEWNGIQLDVQACEEKGNEIRGQILELDSKLESLLDNPLRVNWNSPDQLSAVLYGGEIEYVVKVEDGRFKTGKRAGQVKYRNEVRTVTFPRLVEPLPKTETAKPGIWSTAEPIFLSLKAYGKAKSIIKILLDRAKLEKLVSSYYEGLPKRIRESLWKANTIHGNLNQCVAATGRLSSTKPNLQNNPKEVDKLFVSRYETTTVS